VAPGQVESGRRADVRVQEKRVKPITKLEMYEIDDPAEPYRVVMWCLPPGPPEDPRIGERFPEGSIEVPKSFGAIWFDVSTWQGGFVAQATFAADADAVRCDTITVNEAHRMKGVATQLYETASGVFQGPVIPSDNQTPDAVAFWGGRTQILRP
jgi:hypothetical protein